MANGANYQQSGTEPLRSSPTDEHATITSDRGPASNRIAAAYQRDGTDDLRSDAQDEHATILRSTGAAKSVIPPTVAKFKDASV